MQTARFFIGENNGSYSPDAKIGEAWVSGTVRSNDWLTTEYNNQIAPDKANYPTTGFYTVGSQMSR